jgi:hypothetical protein
VSPAKKRSAGGRKKSRLARGKSGRRSLAVIDSKELEKALRRVERRGGGRPLRWNPDPEDVRRSVVKLVLTLVELIRKVMERQAVRRMQERTLTKDEIEAVGKALMELERTIREIGRTFDLSLDDLNLDLGAMKLF